MEFAIPFYLKNGEMSIPKKQKDIQKTDLDNIRAELQLVETALFFCPNTPQNKKYRTFVQKNLVCLLRVSKFYVTIRI